MNEILLSSAKYGAESRMMDDNDILNGAQLSEKVIFNNKRGCKISGIPLIVDLRRLLHSKSSLSVVPGISNRDLLHAVVALYDVSLNEMTPDVLYSTVCEKWARTLIILRDMKELMEEKGIVKSNSKIDQETKLESKDVVSPEASQKRVVASSGGDDTPSRTTVDDSDTTEDVFIPQDETHNFFSEVFSDSEVEEVTESSEDEEEEEEEEEEEDFSKGVHAFLTSVSERRLASKQGSVLPDPLGIERRIVAAATFDKTYCKSTEKVVQLTLLAVRKQYRNWGVGRYLVSQIKNAAVTGQYDAILVHADASATDFFENNGFCSDVLLNTKWSDLNERFANCTIMSYLPAFSEYTPWKSSIPELDIARMDREIAKWRERSLECYRAEIGCVRRLHQEVIHLRAKVTTQQRLLESLNTSHTEICQQKCLVEKQFLEYKMLVDSAALATASDDEDDVETDQLIRQLDGHTDPGPGKALLTNSEGGVQAFMLARGSHPEVEPYEHGRDTEHFYRVTCEFNKDTSAPERHHVQTVFKAMLPEKVVSDFNEKMTSLREQQSVERLYFCGTLQDSQRAAAILKEGFTDDDFMATEYGRGLYFCKRPSDAAQFSAEGNLLLAEVMVGKVAEVTNKDVERSNAGRNVDSLSVTGSSEDLEVEDGVCDRRGQIIIFDSSQVLPLYLIKYATDHKDT